MKTTLLFIGLFLSSFAYSTEPFFHTVKAKSGDGIYSLLRRYHLDTHNCNLDRFLELNKLSINDNLHSGKKYKLPIKIYKYNGTSIRTTIGIDNFKQALRIKDYNEKILANNLRKTNFLDSNILWVPYHELNCVDEASGKIESSVTSKPKETVKEGKYLSIELFGEKHKIVEIKDDKLKGEVYYIVSGHGGPDPGAMCTKCTSNLCEDEYAYDVSLRLAREIISHGGIAHVIIQDKNDGIRDEPYLECDIDERCFGAKLPLNKVKRLHQRASAINDLYYNHKKHGVKKQVAIMIHVDSNSEELKQDVFFYHHRTSKSSKKIATSLHKTFKEKYNHFQANRGYKGFVRARGLYMLNNTLPTSVYVELANIRNPSNQKRLIMNSNRDALAKWLYEGLAEAKI